MGVRLRCNYNSGLNVRYVLEIHDTTVTNDQNIDFNMNKPGPSISYEGNNLDILHPVVTGLCSFNIRIENALHQLFYEDFLTSNESRFLIKISYYGPGNVLLPYFIGKLVHDLVTVVESPTPILNLAAVDPMKELSYIDFDGSTFRTRYIEVILDQILSKSKTISYFYPNDGDEMLHVYNEYRSTEHPDARDALKKTYIHNYFREKRDGINRKRKCDYVLAELCRALGARLYYVGGRYVLEQISTRVDASPVFDRYAKDQTYLGQTNSNYDINFNSTVRNIEVYPESTFVPPLKSVVLEQNGDVINNLLFGVQYTQDVIPPVQQVSTVTELVENQKVYSRLIINPWIQKLAQYVDPWPKYGYLVFHCRIQIGNRYLKGEGGIIWQSTTQPLSLDITDTEWGFLTTDRVKVYIPARVFFTNLQNNAADYVYAIDIISPIIEEVGDVFFDLTYHGAFTDTTLSTALSTTLPMFFDERYTANSNSIAILTNITDSNDTKGSTLTTLVNDIDNTIIYNTRYDMGSFPNSQDIHRLIVTDTGGAFVDSDQWVHPDLGNMLFQELAIHDIIGLRRIARKRISTTLRMNGSYPITYRNRFLYGGITYLPLMLTMATGEDTCTVLWFEIGKNTANLGPVIVLTPTISDVTGGLWDGPLNTTTNLQGDGGGVSTKYYKQGLAVGAAFLVDDYEELPDPAVITESSINLSMQVYMGGSKQRYKNVAAASLGQGEYRIDFATRSLEWGRNINDRVIEVYAENLYVVDPNNQTL